MSREFYSRDEILTLDPAILTDQELELIIEDAERQVTWAQGERVALAGRDNAAGQTINELVRARNEFQRELDRR